MSAFRILGIVLAVFGTVASIFPDWFAFLTGPPSADTFETVERRVRGGMVLGAGLILIAVPALRSLASGNIALTGNWRSWRISSITSPTAPVAPTTATLASSMTFSTPLLARSLRYAY